MSSFWLVTIGEPLPLAPKVRKLRTGIVADCLIERGHRVRWWTSAFEHQRKLMLFDGELEISPSPGLRINILRGCGYRRNISLRRYVDHMLLSRKFARWAPRCEQPDVIVASMPCYNLAYEAVRYAKERRVPVIIDVRDLWPDIFVDVFPSPLIKALVKGLLVMDYRRLRYLLGKADGILAMSHGVLQWALRHAGRGATENDGVFYLGYNPIEGNESQPLWLREHMARRIIAYVGTFGRSYELSLLVDVARRFHEGGHQDICFVLAGTGEQEEELKWRSRDLPNVIMPGWLRADEIAALLQQAYIGMIPCRSVTDAMPNKIFEYLSAGLPVVSSLMGEMAEIITTKNLGLNYLAGDAEDMYQAIFSLLEDPSRRDEMSNNSRRFFAEKGYAHKIYHDYAAHVEKVRTAALQRTTLNN